MENPLLLDHESNVHRCPVSISAVVLFYEIYPIYPIAASRNLIKLTPLYNRSKTV